MKLSQFLVCYRSCEISPQPNSPRQGCWRIRCTKVLSGTWDWTHVSKPPRLWRLGLILQHCWLWSGCLSIHFSDLQLLVYLGHPFPARDFPHPAIWHPLLFHSHSPSSEQKPHRKPRSCKRSWVLGPCFCTLVFLEGRRRQKEFLENILKGHYQQTITLFIVKW